MRGDRLYCVGDLEDANYLMCLKADGGKALWSTKVGKAGLCGPPGWQYGGPRCTPTVDGDRVLVTPGGSKGAIVALDRTTGAGRFAQPDRAPEKAWAHPTIAHGKLYLRDQDLLLCYDVQ